jgi:LemA protein
MKKALIGVGIMCAFCIMIGMYGIGINNTAIRYEEMIIKSQSDIYGVIELCINNIASQLPTLDRLTEHESTIMKNITDARSMLNSGNLNGAATNLGTTLNIMVEAYPTTQVANNFTFFQTEMASNQQQLLRFRDTYNTQVREYNKHIRTFPNSFILSLNGYEKINYDYLQYEQTTFNKNDINKLFEKK